MQMQKPFSEMLEEMLQGMFIPVTDDGSGFYNRVAETLRQQSLTLEQRETAFRARQMAIDSFERQGATVSPHTELTFQMAWYITQNDLANAWRARP